MSRSRRIDWGAILAAITIVALIVGSFSWWMWERANCDGELIQADIGFACIEDD